MAQDSGSSQDEGNKVVLIERLKTPAALSPREIEIKRAQDDLSPATEQQIASILTSLVAIYGRPDGWEFAIKIYIEALRDIPADALQEAAKTHLRTSKWFPKPSELLDLARDTIGHRRWKLEQVLEDPDWPKWLAEIYGPEPEGPLKRAAALRGEDG